MVYKNTQTSSNETMGPNPSSNESVTINGRKFEIDSSIPPSMTLVDFIRKKAKLFGTKVLCREAGCGVCTVAATFLDLETGNPKTVSVRAVSYKKNSFLEIKFDLLILKILGSNIRYASILFLYIVPNSPLLLLWMEY